MLRHFINPKLAEEIELDRPASSLPERIFRLSLLCFVLIGLAYGFLRVFVPVENLESHSGVLGATVGSIFGVCFLYALNYLAYRFVRSRVVRWTWFLLQAFVVFSIIMAFWIRK
jgi:hypothetical protein